MKKLLSILFAVLLAFSCLSVVAFANDETITVAINQENRITLSSGNTKTFTIKLCGTYTFLTTGSRNVDINRITKTSQSTKYTPLEKSDNGRIFDTNYYYNLMSLSDHSEECTFQISTTDALASIKLWILDYDSSKSCFTKVPANQTFYEDVDYTLNPGVVYKDGKAPDFSNAEFKFRDSLGNDIFTLTGKDVLDICLDPICLLGKITYTSIAGTSNNSFSFTAVPNYIKSAKITNVPEKTYKYGTDGIIKGNVFNYHFIPAVDLTGASVVVTPKTGSEFTTNIKKDSNGVYYIEDIRVGGRVTINLANLAAPNKTQIYDAPISIGVVEASTPISIEKAGFFESIGIFFKALFGQYK